MRAEPEEAACAQMGEVVKGLKTGGGDKEAVDAAVAYAKYAAQAGSEGDDGGTPSPAKRSRSSRGAAEEVVVPVTAQVLSPAGDEEMLEVEAAVAESAGMQLHLSTKSSTGYLGVTYEPKLVGRQYHAQGPRPEQYPIGRYATAVEAAVAPAVRSRIEQRPCWGA